MAEKFTVEQMKELMRSVRENNIGELLLETEGAKLRIRGAALALPSAAVPVPDSARTQPQTAAGAAAGTLPAELQVQEQDDVFYITSPLVGAFYPSSGPDKDPFIAVGQTVKKGDTAFIVESMKVMNEVPSEFDGVVDEILLESGAPVEYGQPVVRLRRE